MLGNNLSFVTRQQRRSRPAILQMMIKIYLLNDMRTEKLGELETINPAASILSEICDDLNECSRAIARRQIPDIEPTKKVKNYRKPDNILIIFCYSTAD